MKLYLALQTSCTFNEGDYEQVLGVFSSPELAAEEFKREHGFNRAEQIGEFSWEYKQDAELTILFEVIVAELDQGLHDY